MANLENVNNTPDKAVGLVRTVWLLGLGVYVKGIAEMQSQFTRINAIRAGLFCELVSKGEEISVDSKEDVAEKPSEATAVEKRVAEVRKQLGLDISSSEQKISELSRKVDELTAILNKLS